LSKILYFWKSPISLIIKKYLNTFEIYSSLEELNVQDVKESKGVVILCELNNDNSETEINMQELYGIELAKRLRREDVNVPIIFTSFFSRKFICENKPNSDIINAIGHKFIRLPVNPNVFIETLNSMSKLSATEMRDVLLFSCNPAGIVSDKVHQIQGVVNKLQSGVSLEEIKDQLAKCIKDIHQPFDKAPNQALSEFRSKFGKIDKENINIALSFIKTKGDTLIEQYGKNAGTVITTGGLRKPWKLLILDDEINESTDLVKMLKKQVEVICVNNADEALNALKMDNELRGKIPVILTDYRLYKDEDGILVQQDKQGYTFLHEVGDTYKGRLISAVVYSGMSRQFLLETFRTYKIRTEIYSKIDFRLNDEGAMNFLLSRILEIGDSNYESILALPCGNSGWDNHLNPEYIKFRQLSNYEILEREICDYCTEWVEQFKVKMNPVTPMIKGDSFKPKINETEEQTIDRFIAYLKTRRLAQYLYLYYQKEDIEDVFDKVIEILIPKGKKISDSTRKGFFSQTMGIKLSEFPFGATIEDLNWFDYDLGIKVLDNYKSFRARFDSAEKQFGSFISDIKLLTDIIEQSNFIIEITPIKKVTSKELSKAVSNKKSREEKRLLKFNKNFEPYFFDRMDFKDCLIFLDLQKENFDKKDFDKYLNFLEEISKKW
jgi:CheY-like chemotaxis protein